MTRTHITIAALVLLACASGASASASAPYHPHNPVTAHSQCAISAAKAGKIASQLYGGKVIDVKQVNANGRTAFRVKLLQPNGRIHSVLIDANSGKPLQ